MNYNPECFMLRNYGCTYFGRNWYLPGRSEPLGSNSKKAICALSILAAEFGWKNAERLHELAEKVARRECLKIAYEVNRSHPVREV
jgi:hypothetical protein